MLILELYFQSHSGLKNLYSWEEDSPPDFILAYWDGTDQFRLVAELFPNRIRLTERRFEKLTGVSPKLRLVVGPYNKQKN